MALAALRPSEERERELAILRIEMVEEIPAYALRLLVTTLDDLYFGHLWLDLAEQSDASEPFPDQYQTTPEETLYVNRLEIGTPNFMEVVGLLEPLKMVFSFVGGAAGLIALGKGVMTLTKDYYDIRDKQLSIEERRLKIKQLSRDLEQEKTVAQPVPEKLIIPPAEADLALRAKLLYEQGRVSQLALDHKTEMNEYSQLISKQLLPQFCERISLIALEGK